MRVSLRLYLTVLPAALALFLLAALAYWGQYAHQVPEAFVIVASIGAVASFILAWRNARYLARRIEKLAGTRGSFSVRQASSAGNVAATKDELTTIESDVEALVDELAAARLREEALRHDVAAERARAIDLLSKAAESATASIESARMPLHILLENRFGELNENQEEMLGAAQLAADDAAMLLRRMRLVADLEAGRTIPRRDALRLDDALTAAIAPVHADAAQRAVKLETIIEPALPRIQGDRVLIHDLLMLLVRDVVMHSVSPGSVTVSISRSEGSIQVRVEGKWDDTLRLDVLLAISISTGIGAKLTWGAQLATVEFQMLSIPVTAVPE